MLVSLTQTKIKEHVGPLPRSWNSNISTGVGLPVLLSVCDFFQQSLSLPFLCVFNTCEDLH